MSTLLLILCLLVLVCLGLEAGKNYYLMKEKRESYYGNTNDVYSKGAVDNTFSYVMPSRNTLISETCEMPNDFSAETIPYCEILPDLGEKTKCYFQCIGTYNGGVRGRCYTNILNTYNKYAKEYNNSAFPQVMPARCEQNDPCCFSNKELETGYGLFDFINYDLL